MSTISTKSNIKLKAILWDIDGTLAKSSNLAYSSSNAVLLKNGFQTISEEDYHYGSRYNTPQRFSWHVSGNPNDNSGVGETLGAQFDEHYVALVSSDTAGLYPIIFDLLKKIRTMDEYIKYGALSNACGAYVRAVLAANEINDIFDVSYGADDVDASKPNPAGLLKCCEVLKLTPNECIYVGDAPTDAQAAKSAGMISVGVTWGSFASSVVNDASFDFVANSVDELEAIFTMLIFQNKKKL
jgi:phosphoglycolate phosphatase-like HAD superfamily hydrolase